MLSTEPSGIHCSAGGTKISVGLDNGDGGGTARDGILQDGEIDQTSYVCAYAPPRRVFVTSSMLLGNFGSAAAASAVCSNLANNAGLSGTYLAWVSDGNGSPSTRFTRSTSGYTLINGTQIATSWTDLTDGTLLHAINMNESGTTVGSVGVWTGTTVDGSVGTTPCNVSGPWTSNTITRSASAGSTSSTNSGWTANSITTCNGTLAFYCFEQ